MLLRIRKYIASERGAVAPMAALLFLTMMGFVALGVDVGGWLMQKRHLQTTVDAAALAGAYELANGQSELAAEAAARKEANNNGYSATALDPNITFTPGTAKVNGTTVPTFKVDITQGQSTWFSSLLPNSQSKVDIKTSATAEVEALDGVFCMLTLGNVPDAIQTSGNATIDAQGCGLASNSSSNSALYLNGNVTVNVGDVRLMGNYTQVGNGTFSYNSLRPGASQTADPYSSLGIADAPITNLACSPWPAAGSTINGPIRFCGNQSPKGDYTINGTVYVTDGSLNFAGQGTISGTGTIVMTSASGSDCATCTISDTGGSTINLNAPTSGYYAGVAFYQDRNTLTTCTDSIAGNASIQINGVMYAPSCGMNYGGTSSVSSVSGICTKIISDTITFHGTPAIGSNCTTSGTKQIGAPAVKLIL